MTINHNEDDYDDYQEPAEDSFQAVSEALYRAELTSQARGGVYYDLGDGRGAVHSEELTSADKAKLGLDQE